MRITQSNLVSQLKSNHIIQNIEYNSNQMSQSFGEWLLRHRKVTSRRNGKLSRDRIQENSYHRSRRFENY